MLTGRSTGERPLAGPTQPGLPPLTTLQAEGHHFCQGPWRGGPPGGGLPVRPLWSGGGDDNARLPLRLRLRLRPGHAAQLPPATTTAEPLATAARQLAFTHLDPFPSMSRTCTRPAGRQGRVSGRARLQHRQGAALLPAEGEGAAAPSGGGGAAVRRGLEQVLDFSLSGISGAGSGFQPVWEKRSRVWISACWEKPALACCGLWPLAGGGGRGCSRAAPALHAPRAGRWYELGSPAKFATGGACWDSKAPCMPCSVGAEGGGGAGRRGGG